MPSQGLPGRDPLGDPRGRAAAQQHDRPGGRGEHRRLGLVDLGQLTGGVEVADHHRERLPTPRLARPNGADRGFGRGVAGQVVAPDPLDRDHRSGVKRGPRRSDRIGAADRGSGGLGRGRGGTSAKGQGGAAVGAGDRLGVEAAVGRVGVLGRARGAHREVGHRGGGPVVGQPGDDREPWTAVGAGDERVAVAAVAGVKQFAQAVRAHRDIGRDRADAVPVDARHDGEARRRLERTLLFGDRGDPRQRRSVRHEQASELGHRPALALHLDEHETRRVAHEPVKQEVGGDPVHERPETDALHHAGDGVAAADGSYRRPRQPHDHGFASERSDRRHTRPNVVIAHRLNQ